ncbi:sigma-70 family RNA polymerase sigma factor [Pedobacter psychrodurus]|uniref:Sigma-70 family RNA polymerase sigma factor n=1 Tax=Pedobacter psychrodurus TaxID=2530456 RepID=A0A4R0Q6F2_9SPHI|nr:sigma-70 family RNA polymerase sigma factor [Pedobacter psychrodurus]TCD28759.1 sigma-70 family RNA polymerase sigma factor [Pedobacter psychrodurus]
MAMQDLNIQDYQKKLFPYAYNILGTYDDAKDAVQDVMAKYYSTGKKDIDNESSYLIKSVINQAINIKKRNSKSIDSGISLPEPVSTESADTNLKRKEIISYSLLVLLESVNTKERAVFILKEAFDYSHEEIGDTLQISTEGSRKLLSRAKIKLGALKRVETNYSFAGTLQLENYIDAVKNGNVKKLEEMLVKDISVMVDGGKLRIVSAFESGVEQVIQLMTYVYAAYQTKTEIKIVSVNHQPALLFYQDGLLVNCQVFDFAKDTTHITGIYSIVDPEKLKNFHKF